MEPTSHGLQQGHSFQLFKPTPSTNNMPSEDWGGYMDWQHQFDTESSPFIFCLENTKGTKGCNSGLIMIQD